MDDILKVAAGYPLIGIALVMLWRITREYRRQMEFWRDKAISLMHAGDAASKVAETVVDRDDLDAQEKWNQVIDIVLERERKNGGNG